MMNPNHIYVDTNVIIGAYANKPNDTACLHYLYSLNGKKLYLSSLSIAQFVSTFQKRVDQNTLRSYVKELLHRFNVVSFQKEDIEKSLLLQNSDLEDNIQYIIGTKVKCLFFVTNNKKDYNFLNISVLKPQNVRTIKR